MIVVKSKLKISACKPEVQQTDMMSVYELCQKSHVGYALTCHSLRMHFCSFSLLFKGHFQSHRLLFRKCEFSKFCKTPNYQKFKMFYCFSVTTMMQITCTLKIFIGNQFSSKIAILHFLPQKFCNIIHIIEFAAKSKIRYWNQPKIMLEIKIVLLGHKKCQK